MVWGEAIERDAARKYQQTIPREKKASICIARIGCSVECVPHSWTFVIFIHQNSARNQNSFGQKEQRECRRKKVQAKRRHTKHADRDRDREREREKK